MGPPIWRGPSHTLQQEGTVILACDILNLLVIFLSVSLISSSSSSFGSLSSGTYFLPYILYFLYLPVLGSVLITSSISLPKGYK